MRSILFFLVVAAPVAAGQVDRVDAIDNLVNRYVELGRFNGSLLVAMNREIIYERVHGVSDYATMEPLTIDHRFRLASVSKQLTGVAILVLHEEGSLALDDPVVEYLPDLPYPGVTLRHLLTNQSGLPDYGSLLEDHWDTENAGDEARRMVTNEDVYDLLVREHPDAEFDAGERYSYCNTGFNLLALVVERVSGQSFPEFMRDRIFEPAGMNDSFINSPDGTLPANSRARGHRSDPAGTGYVNVDRHYQNGLYGDGGVYSTVRDLFRYDQALYDGTLSSPELLQQAFSPARLNDGTEEDYGFGWSVITDDRGDFVAHGGGWAGFSPFFLRDHRNGNTVIQLTNRPGIRRGQLAFAVYEILHGNEVEMPKGSIAETLLGEMKNTDGAHAIRRYHELKKTRPEYYDFSERELNVLGYRLLAMERFEDSIVIFRENVRLHPDSWNAFDSLGEAYLKSGNRSEAELCYRKSLALNPNNDNARKILEQSTP